MELIVVGSNFQTASLAQREAWAESVPRGRPGAVFLSTCNRVELYTVAPRGTEVGFENGEGTYIRRGTSAFSHLIRVAAGLDSMVLGETEVFGQVKRAYQKALQAGPLHPSLHFSFQRAFRAAKNIRTETGISRLPVSVASVGLMLLEQIFGRFEKVRAAVVGMGAMGKQTALGLAKRKVKNPILFGRDLERVKNFAGELTVSSTVLPLEALGGCLTEIDLLVTCTTRPGYLVSASQYIPNGNLQVFLDLGVPRNLDPALSRSGNLFLYNVDDLKEIAEKNLADRRASARAAERMIEQELLEFEKEWNRKSKMALENGGEILAEPKFSGV